MSLWNKIPWQTSIEKQLAYYIIPDITDQLSLTIPNLNNTQANSLVGRRNLVYTLYNWLSDQGIEYAYEKFSVNPHEQKIRTPYEVLIAPKQGTCLDLALGVCWVVFPTRISPFCGGANNTRLCKR